MAQSPSSPSATTNNAAKDDVVGLNGDLTFTIADLLANDPGGAAKNDVSKQFFFGKIADYAANQIVNGIPTVAAQRAYLLAHHIESNAAFTEFTIKNDATDIQYMVQMGNKGTWSQADVDVRHAPTAEAFTNTVEEDKSISGNVKGADIDGDSLTYSLKGTAPAGLTFNSDGSYTFDASGAEFQKLAAGEQKAIQVEYVVNDGHGGTATSTLTITVTGMNDAAKISGEVGGDFDETNEAQVYTGKLEVTDADHDQATFQQQTDVAGKYGSFSIEADGSWNYTMNDAHNEFKQGTDYTDSITVNTADGTAQVISVTIHGANDAPVLTGTPATLAAGTEDTSYTISKADLLAGYTDVENDALSVSGLSSNDGTWAKNADDSWTFKPAANFNGQVNLSYHVTDGNGGDVTVSQTLSLAAVNDAPVLTGTPATLTAGTEDTSYTISKADLLAGYTDVENDALSVSGLSSNDGTWAKNADDSWTFKPAANFNGQVNLSYHVTDGNGGDVTASQTLSLAAVNDAPVLTGTPATLTAGTEDTSYTISKADLLAGYTDVENDALSVSGLSSNDGTWAENADDSWTFKPAANFNGQVNLSYHVTDGNGGDVTASQTLSLAAVNDAPTAVVLSNTVISTSENGGSIKVADIAVTDVDSGTNVLSLSGVDAASFSIMDGAGGGKELHFNGGANFETKAGYDVMVNVNDASVGGNPDASQNFHLAITDVNEAPSVALANTLASTAENGGEIKVADIVVSDDALGTNVVSLSGTDAAAFKIVGTELHFIGGADFETQKSYDVTVNVNDASVGGNPDASQNVHLAITDVVEADSDTTNDYDVRDVNGNLQVTSGGATGNGHTFNGSQQADTIVATNDPINGDQVNAKDGGDTLYGRGGNDDLQGQNGNDTIYGGSGDDNITGGNGADHLWGGSGNDKFVFTTADDSLFNAPDTIHDFHHGFDKIDVHSINSGRGGTGDFTFGGTVATAHGVWFTEGGGNTTVHFDTNGNTGNDEMTITLTGTGLGLTASDFIL